MMFYMFDYGVGCHIRYMCSYMGICPERIAGCYLYMKNVYISITM
jgi:hypothetical protein